MMQAGMMHTGTSVGKTGLVRAIGRWSLAALAVNSIIGSGIFGLPAVVAALLGRRSVLAVLIAGSAMAVIVACFAEVASQFSDAGGPYLYARTAFGRFVGILVGWMFYLAQTAAPAANANLFVIYLAEFWPAAKEPWLRLVVLTLLIGLLALVNVLGARQGIAVSSVFTVAKILPLLMVVLAGAALTIFHPAIPSSVPGAASFPASAWMKAMVLLIFAYGGCPHRLHHNLCVGAMGCRRRPWPRRHHRSSPRRGRAPYHGQSGGEVSSNRGAHFGLWLFKRQTVGHAARHVRARSTRRSAQGLCRR
jgi:amino acid transporter